MIENTGNKTGAQRGADRDPAQGGEQDLVRGGERNDRDEVGGIEAKCDGSNISVARQQGGAGRMILSPWSGNADVGATAAVEPDASLPTGVPRISEMSATLSPISNLRLCSLRTEVAALSEVVLGIL
eukprot:m.242948 g.242948  ORF g.242948 m.242948 type:complete len:127 (+) comp26350_c0_seq6:314-694(+)